MMMRTLILAAALAVLSLSADARSFNARDLSQRDQNDSGRGLGGTDAGRQARSNARGCGCQGPGGLHAGPI